MFFKNYLHNMIIEDKKMKIFRKMLIGIATCIIWQK